MGRSVFIEDSIEQSILRLYGVTKWTTGILVGQPTDQKDYVVHLALTPQDKSNQDNCKSVSSKKESLSKTDFDEDWFVQHCRQVSGMLTGGLKILGIFVFGSPEQRNKLQVKFRQVLYKVHKTLLKDLPLGKLKLDHVSSGQIILQVCSSTKKTTCFSIDVSDATASIHPAEVKYHNFVPRWTALHCSVKLKLKFVLEKKSEKSSLYSNLKVGLLPMVSKIANSLGTVNGVLMSDDQLLVQEKQKKVLEKSSRKNKELEVSLYLTNNDFEPVVQRKSISRHMFLAGAIESYAYVHPKATVKEAIDAIKCDAIRNIVTRCKMLCEDLVDEDSEEAESEKDETVSTWTLPKRMFAPICQGSIRVSDCLFQDEEPKDLVNRLSELLTVSVCEDELVSSEQFSENERYADLLSETDIQLNQNVPTEEKVALNNSMAYRFIGAILGVITVAVAASVKLFWGDS